MRSSTTRGAQLGGRELAGAAAIAQLADLDAIEIVDLLAQQRRRRVVGAASARARPAPRGLPALVLALQRVERDFEFGRRRQSRHAADARIGRARGDHITELVAGAGQPDQRVRRRPGLRRPRVGIAGLGVAIDLEPQLAFELVDRQRPLAPAAPASSICLDRSRACSRNSCISSRSSCAALTAARIATSA